MNDSIQSNPEFEAYLESMERTAGMPVRIYATTLDSRAAIQDLFTLGGFLRLSGLERGEISGPHAAMARLMYYRRD